MSTPALECAAHRRAERQAPTAASVAMAVLLTLTASVPAPEATAQGSAAADRAALVALYDATGGANWHDDTNWLTERPLAEWHGLVTDGDGRVTELRLENNGLTGPLPPDLGNLSRLRWLNLFGNRLRGSVPSTLWRLPLFLLSLGANELTGMVPPEVGNLLDLRFLDLGWTLMAGPLPQTMTNLSLDSLRITESSLCAPANEAFQTWLGTVEQFDGETCVADAGSAEADRAALIALYQATNGANWRNNANWLSTRPVGEWYGVTADGAGRVVELALNHNDLTGMLPPEIGSLSRLRSLVLYDNHNGLTGPLPSALGHLKRLQILALSSNAFTGRLPASLGKLSALSSLALSWTQLRGPLPQSLANLSQLDSLGVEQTFLCAPANTAF